MTPVAWWGTYTLGAAQLARHPPRFSTDFHVLSHTWPWPSVIRLNRRVKLVLRQCIAFESVPSRPTLKSRRTWFVIRQQGARHLGGAQRA